MLQGYNASTEVTARTTIRSPRTYANTSVDGLFNIECPPVLGLVPWLVLCPSPTSLQRELERDARGTNLDALVGLA